MLNCPLLHHHYRGRCNTSFKVPTISRCSTVRKLRSRFTVETHTLQVFYPKPFIPAEAEKKVSCKHANIAGWHLQHLSYSHNTAVWMNESINQSITCPSTQSNKMSNELKVFYFLCSDKSHSRLHHLNNWLATESDWLLENTGDIEGKKKKKEGQNFWA